MKVINNVSVKVSWIDKIKDEFTKAKNGVNFDDIPNENRTLYNWKCNKCGLTWKTTKFQRVIVKKGSCHYCTGQLVDKRKSLGSLYPKLANEWSPKNLLNPFQVLPGSKKKVIWVCEKYSHEWESIINSRTDGKGCPFCNLPEATPEYNLQSLFPNIAKELLTENPINILPASHKTFKWKCNIEECQHIWSQKVIERTRGNAKCPKCLKKIALPGSCLADTHRVLMEEWDFDKNTISPFAITSKNAALEINWLCNKQPLYHKWKIKLESRVSKKPTGCPYCAGQKTSVKESIVETNSMLFNEFDPKLNIVDIKTIREGSHQKIWWKCSNKKCRHSWQATPANRSGINKTGCPNCSRDINKKGESKIEIEVRNKLLSIFKNINMKPKTTNFVFDKGQQITVDIYIEEINLAFDIDPHYTHKNSIKRDKEKSKKLINYCNFFKLREAPLELTSEMDVAFTFNPSNNTLLLIPLIVDKILLLYPDLNKKIKSDLQILKKSISN